MIRYGLKGFSILASPLHPVRGVALGYFFNTSSANSNNAFVGGLSGRSRSSSSLVGFLGREAPGRNAGVLQHGLQPLRLRARIGMVGHVEDEKRRSLVEKTR